MATTTIRVAIDTRDALQQISSEKGITIQEAVQQAVETYRRQQLLVAANAAYAKLRADPEASKDFDDEHAAWDATLADGLEDY